MPDKAPEFEDRFPKSDLPPGASGNTAPNALIKQQDPPVALGQTEPTLPPTAPITQEQLPPTSVPIKQEPAPQQPPASFENQIKEVSGFIEEVEDPFDKEINAVYDVGDEGLTIGGFVQSIAGGINKGTFEDGSTFYSGGAIDAMRWAQEMGFAQSDAWVPPSDIGFQGGRFLGNAIMALPAVAGVGKVAPGATAAYRFFAQQAKSPLVASAYKATATLTGAFSEAMNVYQKAPFAALQADLENSLYAGFGAGIGQKLSKDPLSPAGMFLSSMMGIYGANIGPALGAKFLTRKFIPGLSRKVAGFTKKTLDSVRRSFTGRPKQVPVEVSIEKVRTRVEGLKRFVTKTQPARLAGKEVRERIFQIPDEDLTDDIIARGVRDLMAGSGDSLGGKPLKLTPAMITENQDYLSLETYMLNTSTKTHGDYAGLVDDALGQVDAELANLAPAGTTDPRKFLEARRDMLDFFLEKSTITAMARVKTRLRRLPALATAREKAEATARIFRSETDRVRIASEDTVDQLADILPDEAQMNLNPIHDWVERRIADLRRSDNPSIIPSRIRKLFSGDDSLVARTTNLDEIRNVRRVDIVGARRALKHTRSRTSEMEKLKPDLVRFYNDLDEIVLKTMGDSLDAHSDRAREDFNLFRKSAKHVQDSFYKGPVADFLDLRPADPATIKQSVGMAKFFAQGGEDAAENFDALMRAMKNPEIDATEEPYIDSMMSILDDWYGSQFAVAATDPITGKINPTLAKAFLGKHDRILSRMPELQRELADVATAQLKADSINARYKRIGGNLNNKRKSVAALFVEGTLPEAFERVKDIPGTQGPLNGLKKLVNAWEKDPTGQALPAAKHEYVTQQLFAKSQVESMGTRAGPAQVVKALTRFRKNYARDRALMFESGLFTKEDINRLNVIDNVAKKLLLSLTNEVRLEDILSKQRNIATDIVLRVAGVKVIGAVDPGGTVGGTVQMANIASNLARQAGTVIPDAKARDIIGMAVLDKDMMATLMEELPPVSLDPRQLKRFLIAKDKLRLWLVGFSRLTFEQQQEIMEMQGNDPNTNLDPTLLPSNNPASQTNKGRRSRGRPTQ